MKPWMLLLLATGLAPPLAAAGAVPAAPVPGEAQDRYRRLVAGDNVCDVRVLGGAVGDNATDDTEAVQRAVDACAAAFPLGAVLDFPGPGAYRISRSVALTSNLTLALDANTSIFSARTPDLPIFQHPRCPTLYWKSHSTAVVCGTNLSNVAIIGADAETSVVDGGGWPWYLAAQNKSSGIPYGDGPRLFEVAWTTNVTLSSVTFLNSPNWAVHPTYCQGVLAENLRILAPRFTPNTDGFDPDSSADVVLRDSLIDTGDDGISIKSGNSSVPGAGHIQVPARNIHIYRTVIKSRNFCVGSATFGGIYDLVMEDCEIGDDEGSSPWAIKYKTHPTLPGTMQNHTLRRLKVGRILPNLYQQPDGGYFMSIALHYFGPVQPCAEPWRCPLFQDIHFEDIQVTWALHAGSISGLPGDPLRGLSFRNVTFLNPPRTGWSCGQVDLSSFEAVDVSPPLACKEDAVAEEAREPSGERRDELIMV